MMGAMTDSLQFKRLHEAAQEPSRAHNTDAGYDLYSLGYDMLDGHGEAFDQGSAIEFSNKIICYTGISLAIPQGWVGIVKDRSSMARRGIYTHGGVIDSGYRGELMILFSISQYAEGIYLPDTFGEGAKIAQLVIVPHLAFELEEVDELPEADRGAAGFGSTGR